MEIINGERRSGRTTALINISAISGQPILTPSIKQAAFVEAEARKLGVEIPKVRSFQEIVLARRRGYRDYPTGLGYLTFEEIDKRGGFLIDNADELFEALLSEKLGAKIAAITICAPVVMKERYREEPVGLVPESGELAGEDQADGEGREDGEDREDGKDQAAPMTNAEYLRRVLPALSDQAMLNLLRGGIECCDCPMDQDCRRNAEEAYTKRQAPQFTCGERWERWMEEAVK